MNKNKTSVGHITKKGSENKETLFIKHEFRNELIVVHEAISQVLDGLCAVGKDCSKCFNILKLALVHVDKISNLIDRLSKVCAVKPTPRRMSNKEKGCKMGKLKVLLVDDEAAVLEVIGKRIKSWGYDLVTASGGKQAIDLLKSEGCEVIILDYIMTGMDGIATLKEIRKIDKAIAVIMFTAYPDDRSMKGAQKFKVNVFIPKSSILTDSMSNLKTALAIIEKKRAKNAEGRKK